MANYSTFGCTIGVEAMSQKLRTDIRVAGALDWDAESALNAAVAQVAALVPERVVVDLADVTFAGSTLPNFLARLVDTLPNGMLLTVCRPRPLARWVLDTTGMDRILTISPDRPH